MAKQLYIHGHLVIDQYLQALDGAISVVDGKIEKVYLNTPKFKTSEGYEVIDLKGLIVFPAFLDLSDYSITYYKNSLETKLSVTDKYLIDEKSNYLEIMDKIPLNQLCVDQLFIKTDMLGGFKENLTSLSLKDSTMYVSITKSVIIDSVFNLMMTYLNRKRIIYHCDNYVKDLTYMVKKLNYSLNDILMVCGLNLAQFLNIDHLNSTLTKGKVAKFMVFDQNFNLVKKVG